MRDGQAVGFPAEVGKACGPDAFQIAAVGCQGQVECEDVILGKVTLELLGVKDLAQFCRCGSGGSCFKQTGDLHGER